MHQNDDHAIVVVKARDYRMTPRMLEALADEWDGFRAELSGGIDDIHYEFRLSAHAEGFRNAIRAYKLP